jgi:hypothetical protein
MKRRGQDIVQVLMLVGWARKEAERKEVLASGY